MKSAHSSNKNSKECLVDPTTKTKTENIKNSCYNNIEAIGAEIIVSEERREQTMKTFEPPTKLSTHTSVLSSTSDISNKCKYLFEEYKTQILKPKHSNYRIPVVSYKQENGTGDSIAIAPIKIGMTPMGIKTGQNDNAVKVHAIKTSPMKGKISHNKKISIDLNNATRKKIISYKKRIENVKSISNRKTGSDSKILKDLNHPSTQNSINVIPKNNRGLVEIKTLKNKTSKPKEKQNRTKYRYKSSIQKEDQLNKTYPLTSDIDKVQKYGDVVRTEGQDKQYLPPPQCPKGRFTKKHASLISKLKLSSQKVIDRIKNPKQTKHNKRPNEDSLIIPRNHMKATSKYEKNNIFEIKENGPTKVAVSNNMKDGNKTFKQYETFEDYCKSIQRSPILRLKLIDTKEHEKTREIFEVNKSKKIENEQIKNFKSYSSKVKRVQKTHIAINDSKVHLSPTVILVSNNGSTKIEKTPNVSVSSNTFDNIVSYESKSGKGNNMPNLLRYIHSDKPSDVFNSGLRNERFHIVDNSTQSRVSLTVTKCKDNLQTNKVIKQNQFRPSLDVPRDGFVDKHVSFKCSLKISQHKLLELIKKREQMKHNAFVKEDIQIISNVHENKAILNCKELLPIAISNLSEKKTYNSNCDETTNYYLKNVIFRKPIPNLISIDMDKLRKKGIRYDVNNTKNKLTENKNLCSSKDKKVIMKNDVELTNNFLNKNKDHTIVEKNANITISFNVLTKAIPEDQNPLKINNQIDTSKLRLPLKSDMYSNLVMDPERFKRFQLKSNNIKNYVPLAVCKLKDYVQEIKQLTVQFNNACTIADDDEQVMKKSAPSFSQFNQIQKAVKPNQTENEKGRKKLQPPHLRYVRYSRPIQNNIVQEHTISKPLVQSIVTKPTPSETHKDTSQKIYNVGNYRNIDYNTNISNTSAANSYEPTILSPQELYEHQNGIFKQKRNIEKDVGANIIIKKDTIQSQAKPTLNEIKELSTPQLIKFSIQAILNNADDQGKHCDNTHIGRKCTPCLVSTMNTSTPENEEMPVIMKTQHNQNTNVENMQTATESMQLPVENNSNLSTNISKIGIPFFISGDNLNHKLPLKQICSRRMINNHPNHGYTNINDIHQNNFSNNMYSTHQIPSNYMQDNYTEFCTQNMSQTIQSIAGMPPAIPDVHPLHVYWPYTTFLHPPTQPPSQHLYQDTPELSIESSIIGTQNSIAVEHANTTSSTNNENDKKTETIKNTKRNRKSSACQVSFAEKRIKKRAYSDRSVWITKTEITKQLGKPLKCPVKSDVKRWCPCESVEALDLSTSVRR